MRRKAPAPTPLSANPRDLQNWATQLVNYLEDYNANQEVLAAPVMLQHRVGNEKAVQDGLVMFDALIGEPIYSSAGSWWKFDGTLA